MASSKEYLDFVLDQLSELDDITYRAMMGEYIIYYNGRIVGGIYDDRFLVKPTESAYKMMPDAEKELPYEGAKEMLLVEDVDNKEFLTQLLEAMYEELPAPKKRKQKNKSLTLLFVYPVLLYIGAWDIFLLDKQLTRCYYVSNRYINKIHREFL